MTPKPPRDIHSAEKLHTKALPKTAHAAFKRELSASLASHLEKTVDDIERLDRLVEACGNKLKRMKRDALNCPREEGEAAVTGILLELPIRLSDGFAEQGIVPLEQWKVPGGGQAIFEGG